MTYKELMMQQELTPLDVKSCAELCKNWQTFSNAVGRMNRPEIAKMLRYLMEFRPHSKTLGMRAVQRFNSLNKMRWGQLING